MTYTKDNDNNHFEITAQNTSKNDQNWCVA